MVGLLGMGGFGGLNQADEMQSLLGIDPRAMRNASLKRGLLDAGVAMLSQGPSATPIGFGQMLGQGLGAGLNGMDNARQDYMQQAKMGYDMKRMGVNEAWEAKQRERQEQKWIEDDKRRQAFENMVGDLPEDQRGFAQAYPEQFGEYKFNQAFPATQKQAALPAAIQEYEYAKSQGFQGTFQDWEASKRGAMSIQTNPDGTMTFQQGSNIKPMTEAQSKDTVYSVRAKGANANLEPLETNLTGWAGTGGKTIGQLPVVGNFMKTEGFQKAEQAGDEFLQAILRKDTGAAITEGEQALYGNTFLPRAGDAPEVIAQKRKARQRAILAMEAGMTPQAILAQENALSKTEYGAGGNKSFEEMTDAELEAIANGQ